MRKRTDREAINQGDSPYRLWYAFLQRALADPTVTVKRRIYADWGDIEGITFDDWWETTGAKLIPIARGSGVLLASEVKRNDDGYIFLAVPKGLTPDVAGEQVLTLLSEMGDIKQSSRAPKWRLTEGKELKVVAVRAYLYTYDAQKRLMEQAVKEGKSASSVKAKHVLCEVRRFYSGQLARYGRGKKRYDNLPMRLFHGGFETDPDTLDVDANADAIRGIGDYLKKARLIIANVANGEFPGKV